MSSYLALHRATLTVPVMSPPPRWALTPPFHPYLSRSDQMGSHRLGHRRFDFCGAGVGLLRLGVTQRPAHGVRTFLSMRNAPGDHPVFHPRRISIKNERVSNKQTGQSLFRRPRSARVLTCHLLPVKGRPARGSFSDRCSSPQASTLSIDQSWCRGSDESTRILPGLHRPIPAPSVLRARPTHAGHTQHLRPKESRYSLPRIHVCG